MFTAELGSEKAKFILGALTYLGIIVAEIVLILVFLVNILWMQSMT